MVTEDEQLIISTKDGVVVRTPVKGISRLGRATQGVRLMRLMEGSRVIDVEKTEREAEEDKSEDGEE